jgi:CheY-like chemotaxis protein
MDRETREHVFEPFFTTKEVGQGTGLGLATIYGIVKQLGGHIWLYSEPGQGSTFKLYIPQHDTPVEEPAPRPRVREGSRSGTIMLVEDEDSVREMTSRLLERAGYRVLSVGDGVAALTRISEGGDGIDLVVTDVILPRMSGVRLAERLLETYPSIGLVLISGFLAETLDLSFVIERGARFVSKPIASHEFLAVIDEAMVGALAERAGRGALDR